METAYIDNQEFEIVEGESILAFIKRYKEKNLVPTLCDAPNLEAFGACRVCSVEVALEEDGTVKNNGVLPYTGCCQSIHIYQYRVCKSIAKKYY